MHDVPNKPIMSLLVLLVEMMDVPLDNRPTQVITLIHNISRQYK